MSNALAIAVVTAVLKDILENGLTSHVITTSIGDTLVTALPPDRISVGSDERPQLNVFLYQVSQNRNADWVSRDRTDSHRVHPAAQMPLALDLHYLITAYGVKDFQAELLLGYAMQLLHDIPILTREMVYAALNHAASMSTFGVLSQILASMSIAELADQVGAIKLGPEFFSMEETSKLWSSLQTHYRPSAGYQASMILIESRRPVAEAPVAVVPLAQPTIEQIGSPAGQARSLTPGETLVLRGQHLRGTLTRLRLTGRSALLSPQEVQETQISLVVPLDLPAGLQGIQVVHLEMNRRSATGQEVESNLVGFVVQPVITVEVKAMQPLEDDWCRADLLLTVKPLVGPAQQAVLLLYDRADCEIPYRFPIPSREAATDMLIVAVRVPVGTYWVQLQVDGAQSSIAPTSPNSPQITL